MDTQHKQSVSQSGFTIMELMIATTIFSVILLLCTFGMMKIGRTYYKGIISSRTQSAARAVSDSIVQAIQLEGELKNPPSTIPPQPNLADSGSFCVGSRRFTYTFGTKVSDTTPGVRSDIVTSVGCPDIATQAFNTQNYQELLGPGMRLLQLKIEDTGGGEQRVTVRVAYGDDDLLVDDAGKKMDETGLLVWQAHCKGGTGDEFCAMSELVTYAKKRI